MQNAQTDIPSSGCHIDAENAQQRQRDADMHPQKNEDEHKGQCDDADGKYAHLLFSSFL